MNNESIRAGLSVFQVVHQGDEDAMGDTPQRGLTEIQAELKTVLEAKQAELDALLRQVLAGEMAMESHASRMAKLATEQQSLQEKAASGRQAIADLETTAKQLTNQVQAYETRQEALEQTIADRKAEVHASKTRLHEMDGQQASLEREVEGLQERERLLRQNLVRLQNLKDDLGHTLSGLAAQMAAAGSAKQDS